MQKNLKLRLACTTLAGLTLMLATVSGCKPTRAGAAVADAAATDVTRIEITGKVLQTGVKRFGINLSGQTFYDSGQMMRNLVFRNPGFEGEIWQSILRCKSVTATSCTDENQYAVWPAGFLDGARLTVISGAARGAVGEVRASHAAAGGSGVRMDLGGPLAGLATGDFVLISLEKPGGAEAGWWTDLAGGAKVSTEFNDLAKASPGRQALRIDAALPQQTAKVFSYFDSTEGRSFVQMRGSWTLRFRAKALSRGALLQVSVARLNAKTNNARYLEESIQLAPVWKDYSFPLQPGETGLSVGTVGLSFSAHESSLLLDDVSLTPTLATPANPTAFRDEVVGALRELRPGVLRYMDNGTNFGSTLDNMLAPPMARRRTGASTQSSVREDIPIGLHEFLALAQAVGAEPWYAMPAVTTPEEAAHLVEYLAGAPTTVYGARRAALGQRAPWTSVFSRIHLELGNEEWNNRSFAGSTMNDPTAYGRRAQEIFEAMRAARDFHPDAFDLVLGSWASVPWWTQQEAQASAAHDTVAVAPYLFNELNDGSTVEAVFGPMFAQPEQIDARPDGYMAQQQIAARAGRRGAKLAVYEVNLGTSSGSASQAEIDRAVPTLGAGLAVVDHMLLMTKDLGITTQCLFALPEYRNQFASKAGPARVTPLWGAVIDMGGGTDRRRPQFLATRMVNEAILPTLLEVTQSGQNPMWNQPLSSNDKIQFEGAHKLQTFAFSGPGERSLILINLSRTEPLKLNLRGADFSSTLVEESVLNASSITASNEDEELVSIAKRRLPPLGPEAIYTVPPHSLTTLRWKVAQ